MPTTKESKKLNHHQQEEKEKERLKKVVGLDWRRGSDDSENKDIYI